MLLGEKGATCSSERSRRVVEEAMADDGPGERIRGATGCRCCDDDDRWLEDSSSGWVSWAVVKYVCYSDQLSRHNKMTPNEGLENG